MQLRTQIGGIQGKAVIEEGGQQQHLLSYCDFLLSVPSSKWHGASLYSLFTFSSWSLFLKAGGGHLSTGTLTVHAAYIIYTYSLTILAKRSRGLATCYPIVIGHPLPLSLEFPLPQPHKTASLPSLDGLGGKGVNTRPPWDHWERVVCMHVHSRLAYHTEQIWVTSGQAIVD